MAKGIMPHACEGSRVLVRSAYIGRISPPNRALAHSASRDSGESGANHRQRLVRSRLCTARTVPPFTVAERHIDTSHGFSHRLRLGFPRSRARDRLHAGSLFRTRSQGGRGGQAREAGQEEASVGTDETEDAPPLLGKGSPWASARPHSWGCSQEPRRGSHRGPQTAGSWMLLGREQQGGALGNGWKRRWGPHGRRDVPREPKTGQAVLCGLLPARRPGPLRQTMRLRWRGPRTDLHKSPAVPCALLRP